MLSDMTYRQTRSALHMSVVPGPLATLLTWPNKAYRPSKMSPTFSTWRATKRV